MDMLYVDFKKAFDKLPHRSFIKKEKLAEGIENRISGGRHRTKFNEATSNENKWTAFAPGLIVYMSVIDAGLLCSTANCSNDS